MPACDAGNPGLIPGGGKFNVCLQGALLEDRDDPGQVSLSTYDLHSPDHNAFDASKSTARANGRGLGPGSGDFFGTCEMALSHQGSAIWVHKTYFLTFSVRKEKQIVFHYCRFGPFPVKQHHRSQAASTHQCGASVHPPAVLHHTKLSNSWNTDKPTWIQQLLLQVGTRTLYSTS